MIGKFFKEYQTWYLLYLIIFLGIGGLFLLYHLPSDFLLQTLAFTLTILVLWSSFLFLRYKRKQDTLADAIHDEDLRFLTSPLDKAYLALLIQEREEVQQELLSYKSREEDLQALVKMWSHQMKVPLAALSLMSQTDSLTATDVKHQLLRLDNYMDNLLNYLKLSNQVSDFRFEKVEVREIMVDLVKKYRLHFLQKDMTVAIEGEWQVKTDRKWLSFALSQILDNAIKYNPVKGKITIQLNNGILIADQGIGILEEDIPRLFDEGFTGYNGREHQKASGFGLYLTKRALTQLGLSITVESQLDQGTQVRVFKEQ